MVKLPFRYKYTYTYIIHKSDDYYYLCVCVCVCVCVCRMLQKKRGRDCGTKWRVTPPTLDCSSPPSRTPSIHSLYVLLCCSPVNLVLGVEILWRYTPSFAHFEVAESIISDRYRCPPYRTHVCLGEYNFQIEHLQILVCHMQCDCFGACVFVCQSPEYVVVKIDYLLALSEWLYCHQFPVEDALSQLRWALALLMDTAREEGKREVEEEEGGEDGGREAKFECGVLAREKAVYILVMMAKLQGKGSGGHRESCLAALAHCCLMWKVRIVTHTMLYTMSYLCIYT